MIWASVLGVPVLLAALLQVLLLRFFFHFNPQLVLAAPAILLALCFLCAPGDPNKESFA